MNNIQIQSILKKLIYLFISAFIISCSTDSNESEIKVFTSDFSIVIDENPEPNKVLGTISGTTNQGDIAFEIISQNPENSLVINESTGELKILDDANYDFETNPVITGQVKVSNGTISAISNIIIEINDVSEQLNVFEGDIVLASQEEVDEFGSKNYDEVNGSLEITNLYSTGSNISSLSPLASIKKVKDLYLRNLFGVTDFSGLNNISQITENFELKSCIVSSLDALSSLNSIGGFIKIYSNENLVDLKGLEKVSTIGDFLDITGNELIEDINSLGNLSTIGSDLKIMGNTALKNLDGLRSLSSIGGNFEIIYNESLENINGLSSLSSVGGHLINIERNGKLSSLDGLSSLNSLGNENANYFASIKILENGLVNIDGLSELSNFVGFHGTDAPVIEIRANPYLLNIDGLKGISKSFSINISSNTSLENLDGLSNLALIEEYTLASGNLDIRYNTALEDFCGLTTLIENKGYIDGSITIISNAYNPSTTDILDGNCAN